MGMSISGSRPRSRVVRTIAARVRVELSDEVAELVARQVVGSARLLSGAVNRLVAASMAVRKPITAELAAKALADFSRQHTPRVRLGDIQRAVCDVFGVEPAAPGVRGVSNKEVHRVCGELGFTHYENLCNLHRLVGRGRVRFIGLPLKIRGGTGAPVRAFRSLHRISPFLSGSIRSTMTSSGRSWVSTASASRASVACQTR